MFFIGAIPTYTPNDSARDSLLSHSHQHLVVLVFLKIAILTDIWASLVAQLVKNPPVMWETWVRSLGWEDPPEKGRTTHSSILTWGIPWTV